MKTSKARTSLGGPDDSRHSDHNDPTAKFSSNSAKSTSNSRRWPRIDSDNKVVSGTAAGIAAEIGVDPIYVRIAFILLTLSGGTGVALYGAAWYFMDKNAHRNQTGTSENIKDISALNVDRRATPNLFTNAEALVGFVLIVGGLLVIGVERSVGFGGEIIWPLTLAGIGYALVNAKGSFHSLTESDSNGVRTLSTLRSESSWVRIVAAVAMMLAAVMSALVLNFGRSDALWGGVVATLALGAITLAFTPALGRLIDELSVERRRRVRIEEKAKLAAHLHDSVLQTLTLIQKRSDDTTVVTLARKQERELRSWLYGDSRSGEVPSLKAGLNTALGEVETLHGVPIDIVIVGDFKADSEQGLEQLEAIQKATIQAATNAAIHSGANKVDVFCEVNDERIEVYIRDTGVGFDLDADTIGRAGVRQSIIGRMERIGGTAHISTSPDNGTEVELCLELDVETPKTESDNTATVKNQPAPKITADDRIEPDRHNEVTQVDSVSGVAGDNTNSATGSDRK